MKKNLRYFMTLLLMMVASVGWAQTTVSMTSFTAISGIVGDDENISYEAAKGTAGTAPAVNSGEIRVYQNGGTFTVTANNGSKINSITLGSSMATTVTYKVDNGDTSENQTITAKGTITVSDLNASTVLFTCTGTDKNSRLYVNYLSVTYTASSVATAGLAFDPSEVTLKVGETSTSTFSQKTSAIATFTNSNESVATYDPTTGSISALAVGETTITATTAEVSGKYQAGEATLTIIVKKAAVEGEIFYESFDNCTGTGGNDGEWSGTIAQNAFSDSNADNKGWELENGNAANKCIKLGTGKNKGSATTPTITFEQGYQYTITFKAAAWNGDSEKTTLNLSTTAGVLDNESVTMKKGEWSTYNITINTTTTSGTITFEAGNVSNNRFFLDEISIIKGEAVEVKTIPTLSFPETTYEVIVGNTFSAPTLTSNSDGVVSYSSSNTDVASVNASTGVVSIVGVGTTTITATSAETDNYYEGTASYTLIVNPDPDGPGTENNPFTVAQALEIINGLEDGKTTSETYTVKGFVVGTPDFQRKDDGTLYGNCNFEIADSKGGSTTLTVFRAKSFENKNFTEEDVAAPILKEGDGVVLTGKLQKYVKDEVMTPELTYGHLVSVNVTITSCGYATLISNHALDFSKAGGATAYIVKDNDISDNAITLTPVTKVPANTGLVIAGTAGETYSIPAISDETDDVDGNLMVGNANEDITMEANQGYILAASDGLFHPCSGGTLAKGKAYLNVAVPTPTPGEAKNLTIVFGEGTGINNVNVNENESGKIFNLAGQQMKSAVKGVYIKNGKKYVK